MFNISNIKRNYGEIEYGVEENMLTYLSNFPLLLNSLFKCFVIQLVKYLLKVISQDLSTAYPIAYSVPGTEVGYRHISEQLEPTLCSH